VIFNKFAVGAMRRQDLKDEKILNSEKKTKNQKRHMSGEMGERERENGIMIDSFEDVL